IGRVTAELPQALHQLPSDVDRPARSDISQRDQPIVAAGRQIEVVLVVRLKSCAARSPYVAARDGIKQTRDTESRNDDRRPPRSAEILGHCAEITAPSCICRATQANDRSQSRD